MNESTLQGRASEMLRSALLSQEGVLLFILVLSVLLLSTQTDVFLTVDNLLNQGRLLTEIGLLALPMTYIIITGGIDLSVGSIFGLSAIMLGYSWQNWGLPLEVAVVVALLTGLVSGFINGLVYRARGCATADHDSGNPGPVPRHGAGD